ncbi:serine protease [Donghicola mangrovi]|uniref:Peptidoglycan-binding protein n=1 Tax=Donghicola mangrovi TaxID=2729614 RepID=A0A850Q6P6_9RHOB|nr:serine protease [Donghicola mangrovi]NVO23832.1 peptidoglycan-binding protein [Donghicola mangrovi]
MNRYLSLLTTVSVFAASAAIAQEVAYIQIEAQPTLNEAQFRAQAYAGALPQVSGYALGSGWYAITLGPFDRDQAELLRREYLRSGQIPRDAYITDGREYQQQYWPVGAVTAPLAEPPVTGEPPAPVVEVTPLDEPPVVDTASPEPVAELPPLPDVAPVFIEETPYEARASESLLTADERYMLQVALKWAGFYDGRIDGAYGQGTRASMANWQAANGFEPTGILTTFQRSELLAKYNAVFDGLGFETVADSEAGIQIELPMAALKFDGYTAPFARYMPSGDLPVQVHLISEPGDAATLGGLYEIMQTLQIIPLDGARKLTRTGFVIEGANDEIVSYTEVSLVDNQIKGYTLVWPAGDEGRRTRVIDRMSASFTRIPGLLSGGADLDVQQSIDMVAGLDVRKPSFTRSGMWADGAGRVLTLAEGLDTCSSILLESEHEATVAAVDASGLALLAPKDALAPLAQPLLQKSMPRLQTEIAVAGYSFGGQLGAPSVTFGTVEDMQDLSGDNTRMRLSAHTTDADFGGPVLDMSGAVIGLLAPQKDSSRALPDDVRFAIKEGGLEAFLATQGITAGTTTDVGRMEAEDLRHAASDLTTLVECWK